jgi:hypothetical protein
MDQTRPRTNLKTLSRLNDPYSARMTRIGVFRQTREIDLAGDQPAE